MLEAFDIISHSPGDIAPVAVLRPTSFRLDPKDGISGAGLKDAEVVEVPAGGTNSGSRPKLCYLPSSGSEGAAQQSGLAAASMSGVLSAIAVVAVQCKGDQVLGTVHRRAAGDCRIRGEDAAAAAAAAAPGQMAPRGDAAAGSASPHPHAAGCGAGAARCPGDLT